ncbi:major facilitator superfamily domain-containing protein [Roridomyces roridus]|uniref:Major facilitator superfamily domain-containing protein n=1 Tax=Roridomyces roridus TaxID=1738132 RepID=A0AAD7B665_9AGAR|nr:major facilitator superfamily domain-containing protein [Roridomyces roridus]
MEKVSPVDLEKHVDSSSVGSDQAVVDPQLEARVWGKLDLWILPVVAMFYLLSFLDRTNIGNAKVAGLLKDLDMTPRQYSIALTVTYVPYIAAELPSNLLLKTVGANRMLPTMITLWGVVTACQGAVTSYGGLLVCRFFLGLLEGGVFPGIVLYLSCFYPRLKLQTRVSGFLSTASLAGAFGGILAYGIIQLNGKHGHSGWQWIFIIEGVITSFIGLISFPVLPATPETARFLNKEEKAYVKARLVEDGVINEAADSFSWGEVAKGFTSIHVLISSVLFFFGGVVLYSLAYFAPSIIQSLGYSASKAQLMSVPPFSVAFVLTMITAWISDRYHCRGAVSVLSAVFCVIGFSMFLGSKNHHVQYASLFLSVTGSYIQACSVSTWNANNSAPLVRRATAIAFAFIMTNSGGILSTWLLGSLSAPPFYTKATKILLSFSVLMAVFSVLNMAYLANENRKKAQMRKDISREDEDPSLGDRSAWFVYSL